MSAGIYAQWIHEYLDCPELASCPSSKTHQHQSPPSQLPPLSLELMVSLSALVAELALASRLELVRTRPPIRVQCLHLLALVAVRPAHSAQPQARRSHPASLRRGAAPRSSRRRPGRSSRPAPPKPPQEAGAQAAHRLAPPNAGPAAAPSRPAGCRPAASRRPRAPQRSAGKRSP